MPVPYSEELEGEDSVCALYIVNAIAHSICLTAPRKNYACACAPRSVSVLSQPQTWFQQLLNDDAIAMKDHAFVAFNTQS